MIDDQLVKQSHEIKSLHFFSLQELNNIIHTSHRNDGKWIKVWTYWWLDHLPYEKDWIPCNKPFCTYKYTPTCSEKMPLWLACDKNKPLVLVVIILPIYDTFYVINSEVTVFMQQFFFLCMRYKLGFDEREYQWLILATM